jgi:hypothetical protein
LDDPARARLMEALTQLANSLADEKTEPPAPISP